MSIDPVFVAEFAEAKFLAPVPRDDGGRLHQGHGQRRDRGLQVEGRLVAVPFWANTQLLWYRKSVAKAAGLDMTRPVTWEQLIKAAGAQKKTIGVQASRYEGYVVWINALIAGAGGKILLNPGATADRVKLGLETPAGRAASTVIQQVARTGVGGPALSSTTETESLNLFSNSASSGFLVNWPYTWAALPTNGVKFIDDIGWAKYPETVAGKPSAPPFGGIELGVGAFSAHPDLAYDAAKCITSPEHQKLYMLGTGNPAANKTVYDDPAIRKQLPMAALIRQSLEAAAPRPQSQYYGDISTGLQREFSPPDSVEPAQHPRGRHGPDHLGPEGKRAAMTTFADETGQEAHPTAIAHARRSSPTARRPSARSAGSWPGQRSSSCSRSRPTRSSTPCGCRCSTTA